LSHTLCDDASGVNILKEKAGRHISSQLLLEGSSLSSQSISMVDSGVVDVVREMAKEAVIEDKANNSILDNIYFEIDEINSNPSMIVLLKAIGLCLSIH
jgi:hypothetical protein